MTTVFRRNIGMTALPNLARACSDSLYLMMDISGFAGDCTGGGSRREVRLLDSTIISVHP
jgi:hypothetical protein